MTGRYDRVCAARPPFELLRVGTVADCSTSGDCCPDNAVINRVELGSRLLKLELYGAGSFHAVGQDKGVTNRLAHDNQAVVPQHHNVPVAEIGEKASPFLAASAAAFVIMVGHIAEYLQRVLVQ